MRLRVEAAGAVREVLRIAAVHDKLPGVARDIAADDAVVGGRGRAVPLRAVEVTAIVAGLCTGRARHRVLLRAGLGLCFRSRDLVGDAAGEREPEGTRHE